MKKTASFFLVLISLCALLLCCLLSASAVGETITLLPLKVGEIDYGQTRSFQFNVPALSEVELYFFGYYEDEDEYEEYETEGDVKIQIKDSDKDVVYYEEARFSGRSLSLLLLKKETTRFFFPRTVRHIITKTMEIIIRMTIKTIIKIMTKKMMSGTMTSVVTTIGVMTTGTMTIGMMKKHLNTASMFQLSFWKTFSPRILP